MTFPGSIIFISFLWATQSAPDLVKSDINATQICALAKEWKITDLSKTHSAKAAELKSAYQQGQLSLDQALAMPPTSMYVLGNELVMSDIPREYEDGVVLLKKAAVQGDTPAISRLGMHLVNRTTDKEAGLQLIHCAAIKGRFDAAAFLGNYYGFSPGNAPEKAPFYLELAVEVGVSLSEYQLAGMLLYGKHVQKNTARAKRLYKSSAEKGGLQARYMYAYMLESGFDGENPDYIGAINWYLKAADSEWREGPPEAARLMHLIGQVKEAEALLREEAAKGVIGSERAKELLQKMKEL